MNNNIIGEFKKGESHITYGGAFIGQEERRAIEKVLDRNWWTMNGEGVILEKELAQTSGVENCVLTNSGSSALLLAMKSIKQVYNLLDYSEVIIPATNFPTVVSASLNANLTPVFIDVNLDSLCIDETEIEKAITKKSKVLVVVAIGGNLPDLKKIREIAKKHKLITVLDNCDGYGSMWEGKPVEKYFDISVTSFHAAHILAMGEGGAMFTNNKKATAFAKSLREWGRAGNNDKFVDNDYPARYTYITQGYNIKPLELQCAMGRVQLRKLRKIRSLRDRNYNLLFNALREDEVKGRISLIKKQEKATISWFSFPFLIKKPWLRNRLMEFLEKKKNIEVRVIFAGNIRKQPAYKDVGRQVGDLNHADIVMRDGIFVSVHPSNTIVMMKYVADSIKEFFEREK